jgi:hypothetical protein
MSPNLVINEGEFVDSFDVELTNLYSGFSNKNIHLQV